MTREKAIKNLRFVLSALDENSQIAEVYRMAIKALEQEPKTGHWITKEAYSEDKAMGFTEQIVCSNCDMQNSYFSEWDECKNPISKTFIRSKFCPNCGCRMVEPQESEDECKNCKYYHNPDYTRCHKCKAESEDKE